MNFVIDASAVIAVVANEPEKEELIKITAGADLIAPASIPWEIGNAFSAMLKRRRITLVQALEAVAIYQQVPIRYVDINISEALKIAAEHNIYAYDAYLLQCAMKYRMPLLTLDKRLADLAKKMRIAVVEVTG